MIYSHHCDIYNNGFFVFVFNYYSYMLTLSTAPLRKSVVLDRTLNYM